MSNEIQTQMTAPIDVSDKSIFSNVEKFEQVKYMAEFLATSDLVPKDYKGKPANVLIALSMAERIKADPMMVMQNLYVIHGRPSWSSQFLIACVNSCGRFSSLLYEEAQGQVVTVEYESWYQNKKTVKKETVKNDSCRAYATELSSGNIVYGPWVSVEMAVKEGWYSKAGSKWKTMPQLMLTYRAAAFFVRTKAPEISMGMHTEEEVRDMGPAVVVVENDVPPTSGKSVEHMLDSLQKPEVKKPVKKAAKKKAPAKKAEPVVEQITEPESEIDMLQFFKGCIDNCDSHEDLNECGVEIEDQSDTLTPGQHEELNPYFEAKRNKLNAEAE